VSHRIVVSPEARSQLDDLYDHIAAAASPATALRFINAVLDQLDALRDFPRVGTQRGDILTGLRTIGFRRRVTIAFVGEATEVLVLGVFYGGQDFETALKDD